MDPWAEAASYAGGLALGMTALWIRGHHVRRKAADGAWVVFDARIRGDVDPYPRRFRRVKLAVRDGDPHLTGGRGLRIAPGALHITHERRSTLRDRVGNEQVLVGTAADGTPVELAVRAPDAPLLREALARVPVDRSPQPGLVDLSARARRPVPAHPPIPPGPGERAAWALAALAVLGLLWLRLFDVSISGLMPVVQGAAVIVPALVAIGLGARRRS